MAAILFPSQSAKQKKCTKDRHLIQRVVREDNAFVGEEDAADHLIACHVTDNIVVQKCRWINGMGMSFNKVVVQDTKTMWHLTSFVKWDGAFSVSDSIDMVQK